MRNRIPLILGIALWFPAPAFASTWGIDPSNSGASFSVRHLMVNIVRGQFRGVAGTIVLDDKDITKSTVEATVDATSVDSREEKRDGHLKSPDFLDVTKFPTMTFKSRKVTRAGKNHLKVLGDLTIHGVTKEVTLDVEQNGVSKDPWGNAKAGFTATTKISRKDFGLLWNKALETGGVVVGDEVGITVDVEAVKKAETALAK